MSNSNDAIAQALADAGRPRETWQPQKAGDAIAGRVFELAEIETEYGVSPLVTLDVPNVEALQQIAGFGKVLGDRFRMANPPIEVGDILAVTYQGEKTPRSGGKAYHDWTTIHRDPTGQPKKATSGAAARREPDDGLVPGPPEGWDDDHR
jgi:hypothetical protein